MKRWLVVILLLITAAGTFVPCCQSDNCCADEVTADHENNSQAKEGICSPFFACATCPGSVEISNIIEVVEPVQTKPAHHSKQLSIRLSFYTASFWQPPRHC